jgi:DNA polymerase-3 subunit gamma/tau
MSMAYEVLARRWRPQSFDDVVGQEHVTRTLRNAIRTQRVAHAYLFVGPRGIGKTSIARILAKALNCREGPTETPCGACPSCEEIVKGSSLDVVEIDGASNRGIDEIRALRDGVKYAAHGRFRIYIVDEVHQLTSEAFNALLKTLEEPPPHVKFFFATTEAHKVPMTILSRCQRFDLRRIPTALIVERLGLIAKAESVAVEPAALDALARAAEGGLRDAESALDQMIAFQGASIREEDVLAAFGLVSRQAIDQLAGDLLAGNMAKAIEWVETLDRQGKAMPRLLLELVEHFRNLLIYLEIGDRIQALDLGTSGLDTLKRQAEVAKPGRVLRLVDTLLETLDGLPRALSQKTWVETGLIRCARVATVAGVDELLRQVREWRAELAASGGAPAPAEPGRPAAPSASTPAGGRPAPAQPMLPSRPPPAERAPARAVGDKDLELLIAQWHEIANRAGQITALAKGYLLEGKPVAVTPEKVVVEYDPESADRVELAAGTRNRQAIQRVLADALGRPVTVEFRVAAADAVETSPPANPAPAGPAGDQVRPGASAPLAVREKWMKQESVQKTAKAFKARITDVKE